MRACRFASGQDTAVGHGDARGPHDDLGALLVPQRRVDQKVWRSLAGVVLDCVEHDCRPHMLWHLGKLGVPFRELLGLLGRLYEQHRTVWDLVEHPGERRLERRCDRLDDPSLLRENGVIVVRDALSADSLHEAVAYFEATLDDPELDTASNEKRWHDQHVGGRVYRGQLVGVHKLAARLPALQAEVGAMLEQPFGVEAADISLLSIGADLSDDLDGILRSAQTVARRAAMPMRDSVASMGVRKRVADEDNGENDDDGGDDEGGDDEGGDDDGGDDGGDGGDA